MEISKKDWKLFREKLSDWQERYMEGLVKEYVNFLNDDTKPASEKFWEMEKRIKEDKVNKENVRLVTLEFEDFCKQGTEKQFDENKHLNEQTRFIYNKLKKLL